MAGAGRPSRAAPGPQMADVEGSPGARAPRARRGRGSEASTAGPTRIGGAGRIVSPAGRGAPPPGSAPAAARGGKLSRPLAGASFAFTRRSARRRSPARVPGLGQPHSDCRTTALPVAAFADRPSGPHRIFVPVPCASSCESRGQYAPRWLCCDLRCSRAVMFASCATRAWQTLAARVIAAGGKGGTAYVRATRLGAGSMLRCRRRAGRLDGASGLAGYRRSAPLPAATSDWVSTDACDVGLLEVAVVVAKRAIALAALAAAAPIASVDRSFAPSGPIWPEKGVGRGGVSWRVWRENGPPARASVGAARGERGRVGGGGGCASGAAGAGRFGLRVGRGGMLKPGGGGIRWRIATAAWSAEAGVGARKGRRGSGRRCGGAGGDSG